MENLSQGIILCSPSFPIIFLFCWSFVVKRDRTNIQEFTAFLLCFDLPPCFLHCFLECFRWGGFTNTEEKRAGHTLSLCSWLDACNALGWAPGGVRICCAKFGCSVVIFAGIRCFNFPYPAFSRRRLCHVVKKYIMARPNLLSFWSQAFLYFSLSMSEIWPLSLQFPHFLQQLSDFPVSLGTRSLDFQSGHIWADLVTTGSIFICGGEIRASRMRFSWPTIDIFGEWEELACNA